MRKRLAVRINAAGVEKAYSTDTVGADKRLAVRINTYGTDKHLRDFLSGPKRTVSFPFRPIKNPAVSGAFIVFKTGHTKKCLTVFPLHNHFAKRVVRVVRAVFPLKIFIVHHFAHFLLGGIIRLYILG